MESIGLKEARKKAEEMDKSLRAYDFGKYIIEFQHGDGTCCRYDSAIYKEVDKDWIVIFTEHHGTLVYHKEDLKWVKQWERPKVLYWNEE